MANSPWRARAQQPDLEIYRRRRSLYCWQTPTRNTTSTSENAAGTYLVCFFEAAFIHELQSRFLEISIGPSFDIPLFEDWKMSEKWIKDG